MMEQCKFMKKYDYLVVGSGLYGAIFAHEATGISSSISMKWTMLFISNL